MSGVGDDTILQLNGPTRGDSLVGSVVDSYRVESVVGTGAMGIVYRGVHVVIGKPVAIKVLKPDYADDPDMVHRLVQEARTVNAIRHPGIVDIFGFGTLPRTRQPYIVMDLLEGQPLDVYIQREAPVTARVAGLILDELLGALHAAHQVGVVHRDLKPGNIFLEKLPEGGFKLKVIDFGLARQAERVGGSIRPTNPGSVIGTPAFMAPEQVVGKKLSPATDLYAVGGIAYQLLTRHLPHEAPSAIEVLTLRIAHDPIRPKAWNPRLSDELDGWIMSLLAREMEDRLGDADEARRRLRRLLETRTQAYQSVPPPSRSQAHLGVVPKAAPVGSATVLIDGSEGASSERSTDEHSPLAQTLVPSVPDHLRQTTKVPPSGAPGDETLRPVEPTPRTPAGEPVTSPVSVPDEELRLAIGPSRTPLAVALVVALAALVGGVWWLVSQP